MTYKGRPPKDDEDRARRNAPIFAKVPIEWDGLCRGPDLPERYSWCLRTREWWELWRHSAQAMVMLDSDWESMLETALIHNKLWSYPDELTGPAMTNLSAELRRRVSAYGATHEDRLKLHITIDTPQSRQAEETEVRQAAQKGVDYLEMMTKEAAKLQQE